MVEDKLRSIEDVAENASEKPIRDYIDDDGTTLKPTEMQDRGGVVPTSVGKTVTDAEHDFPKRDISASSEDADRRRWNNEHLSAPDEGSNCQRGLPQTGSSDNDDGSPGPEESTEHAADCFTEKIQEKAAPATEPVFQSTLIVEDEASSADSGRTNNSAEHLSLRDGSWDSSRENFEEASIEDSCEKQLTFDRSESSETSKQTKNHASSNRSSTLIEDSRLVKIPLPTTSVNIMQSNAQFLNKSRNFLNFITEKSTNIMEKTLLPQNIAVRYNSLLKHSDVGCASEKKHSEACSGKIEPSADVPSIVDGSSNARSPITSNNGETICPGKKISEDSRETNVSNEISRNSESLSADKDFDSGRDNARLPGDNDVDDVSRENREESVDWRTKSADGDEGINEETRKLSENESAKLEYDRKDETDGVLRNPMYLTLVRDYARARDEKLKLADRVKQLEEKNRILEARNSGELFTVQLETLEKTVERLSGELRLANGNREELSRDYAAANKERESMVMKYAVSEKQLIDTQRARDYAERRFKEIAKDHELLQNKLRQSQNERTRICGIMDTKCRELTEAQKEVERLKEDVNVRDVKLKWTQTKLKTEMEAQKETQQKLDKAVTRINDMKEECEQVRRESQEMIWKFQHSEENKAVTLDQQLKEQQARLILERHVTEDKEMLRIQLQKEVDLLKNRQQTLIEENNMLSLKIQDLEKDRLGYESKLSELKTVTDQRQKEIVDLCAKVSHLETLKLQLIHKEQCLASNEAEVERLRQVNQDLQADMDCCRQREAHMLDFTQKLTDKNVRLQSEFTAVEAKAAQLEHEQGPLRDEIADLRTKAKTLETNLSHERTKRMEECEILARHLAEQTQLAQNLSEKLEDSHGEIAVLRRKQQISVKEMSRELQQFRKKLEAYENASPSGSIDSTSRAGSNVSLNTGETLNGVPSDNTGNGEHGIRSLELDQQSLLERYIKLQKISVRRAEKIDFLEEHARTLVAELQKKTKIIQNYIFRENFDAMGSNERDRHKAELARHGGIMASVYNHRVSDDNMTLELSLEINQKLQAVLEDALLKNITLKDNIDTLGEEIARLTIKNQQLLQQKPK